MGGEAGTVPALPELWLAVWFSGVLEAERRGTEQLLAHMGGHAPRGAEATFGETSSLGRSVRESTRRPVCPLKRSRLFTLCPLRLDVGTLALSYVNESFFLSHWREAVGGIPTFSPDTLAPFPTAGTSSHIMTPPPASLPQIPSLVPHALSRQILSPTHEPARVTSRTESHVFSVLQAGTLPLPFDPDFLEEPRPLCSVVRGALPTFTDPPQTARVGSGGPPSWAHPAYPHPPQLQLRGQVCLGEALPGQCPLHARAHGHSL